MCPTFLAGTAANREDSGAFDCEIFPFSTLFKILCKFFVRPPVSSHLLFSVAYICVLRMWASLPRSDPRSQTNSV